MNNEQKDEIVAAAARYMTETGVSQNELARISKVTYLNPMLKGVYTYTNSRTGEESPIPDKWFETLAVSIGYKFDKDYWPTVVTSQFRDIIKALEEAKADKVSRMVIGSQGCGKTYTINRFVKGSPIATFVITCHASTSERSLHERIMRVLNIDATGSPDARLDKIRTELWRLDRAGKSPVLIFDEAENLRLPTFQAIKAIYDYLEGFCGLVLIGTGQLIKKIERLKAKDADGIPQFHRRFKAGTRYVREVDTTFKAFLSDKPIPGGLKRLIASMSEDYGDVRNYLEPALKAADKAGVPLTEEFFRTINNLNNNQYGTKM